MKKIIKKFNVFRIMHLIVTVGVVCLSMLLLIGCDAISYDIVAETVNDTIDCVHCEMPKEYESLHKVQAVETINDKIKCVHYEIPNENESLNRVEEMPYRYFFDNSITLKISDSIYLYLSVRVINEFIEYFDDNAIHSEIFTSLFNLEIQTPVVFCEFNHQYRIGMHQKLMFIFNADINNFQWLEIYYDPSLGIDDITGNPNFTINTLFSVYELKSNHPFIATWSWIWGGGLGPYARGISFIDEYGNTRMFTFSDNSAGYPIPSWSIWEISKTQPAS